MVQIDVELIQKIALYAVILNIVLPQVLKNFATEEEIKPPNGAQHLSFKGQIMHMFVHHAQVPVSSSIIVAVIVAASIILSDNYPIV